MNRPTNTARARKQACRVLGIELQNRYRALVEAQGDDEIAAKAVELGKLFNDNIEFVIWALKKQGGLEPPNPEPIRTRPRLPAAPANDLPQTPAIFLNPEPA